METIKTYKKKHTYADYRLTPEGAAYQLLNGNILHEPDSPYISHQMISKKMFRLLDNFCIKNNSGTVMYAPVDVYFDDENCVQPDLLFVSEKRKSIITEKNIQGAPDLVVEIVSPGSEYTDMVEKKNLYEKFGVKEYWLVFPAQKAVEVFILMDNQYNLYARYSENDVLDSSVALSGIKIYLIDIFEDNKKNASR